MLAELAAVALLSGWVVTPTKPLEPPEQASVVYVGWEQPPPVPGHMRICSQEVVQDGPYAGYRVGICVWRPVVETAG
jgi:hypothetical protein